MPNSYLNAFKLGNGDYIVEFSGAQIGSPDIQGINYVTVSPNRSIVKHIADRFKWKSAKKNKGSKPLKLSFSNRAIKNGYKRKLRESRFEKRTVLGGFELSQIQVSR